MPMRRPWMRSYTWPTQMGRAACHCAEAALTRDRAFGRSGTLLLTEKGALKKQKKLISRCHESRGGRVG